ncbi:MAG: heat-inducible transcriptional repressor HrcA [Acidimicrobiia bacterium]|nr:heat-inducible transcriptional repressor HrcA [Acidimicrobiia bacterium]
MVEGRRSEVLRALVEEHIRTGEPVSSRAVLERSKLGVSAATVRNDLSALEREGYAIQPHTSAGRVPTPEAYRYYVDHLGPARLRQATQARIASFFGDVHLELSNLLQATSDLLAEVTDLPAVVVAPGVSHDKVRSVHSVQVTTDQILVVVVTEAGRVVQQRGRVRVPVTALEIEEAQRNVSEAAVGHELGSPLQFSDDLLNDVAQPVRESMLTIGDCLHLAATAGTEIFVGGAQRMPLVWNDLSTVERVLEILQREAAVMKMLAGVTGTSIQLGTDIEERAIDLAVVSRTYEAKGEAGSVGVMGPMRMNYKRAISAVEEVSRELEEEIGSRSN